MDCYHIQVTEGDITTKLKKYAALCEHIQIAGVPERNEPDTGEVNYTYLFKVLDDIGYKGWIGCEYRPAAGNRGRFGLVQAPGLRSSARQGAARCSNVAVAAGERLSLSAHEKALLFVPRLAPLQPCHCSLVRIVRSRNVICESVRGIRRALSPGVQSLRWPCAGPGVSPKAISKSLSARCTASRRSIKWPRYSRTVPRMSLRCVSLRSRF